VSSLFVSLPYPSLRFPSLPFPSLPFASLPFPFSPSLEADPQGAGLSPTRGGSLHYGNPARLLLLVIITSVLLGRFWKTAGDSLARLEGRVESPAGEYFRDDIIEDEPPVQD